MARLVTTKFKIHNAEQFIESLSETSATNLYLFIGKVQEWDDENAPPAPNEAVANTLYSYWDQMIAAKKVTSADVKHVITRTNWESNTSYTSYTHTNSDQLANNFYVVTEDFNVYKCLQNNLSNGASTIKPTGTGTAVIEVADGYKWKYMYTITSQDTLKFTTSEYIPVQKSVDSRQIAVEDAAIDGQIDIINKTSNGDFKVEFTAAPENAVGDSQDFVSGETLIGQTSNQYGTLVSFTSAANNLTYSVSAGNVKFSNSEVVLGSSSNARATISNTPTSTYEFDTGIFASVTNSTVMQLSTSANNSVDGLYVNSTVFVVNNAGQGEQTTITQYDSALRQITVDPAFTITPTTVSGYEVAPSITINGDGTAFKGRTRGNVSHGITEVTVTEKGSKYTVANPSIFANSSYGTGANSEVIIGPVGGHGKNAIEELGGNRVMVDSRISGNESGRFTTSNDFRQVGLLRDPLQTANTLAFFTESLSDQSTTLSIGGVAGSFQADEKVYTGTSLANSTANGVVVDFLNNNTLRINEVKGTFQDSNVVTGANTSSTGTISANGVTQPGMKPYSGDVLYIENREKITRLQNQVEDFKIVLEF
tara:strand:+ start:1037 stop:2818 length:1782 start_codon:yes stop_codon:yes gene_type:complete